MSTVAKPVTAPKKRTQKEMIDDLVGELTARRMLLDEPAPSWEPRAHDRHRKAYQEAALKLADVFVRPRLLLLERAEKAMRKRKEAQ